MYKYFLQGLRIGVISNLFLLWASLTIANISNDLFLVVPAIILISVSAFRCLFPVNYASKSVIIDSVLSSVFVTRFLVTIVEVTYIYMFSYVLRIINSDQYDIELPFIPYEPVVAKIEIPGQVEILTLSEYLNIKPELLYKLNAGYTKWASAPSEKSVFYIPIEQYDFFQTTENPFSDSNQINWISHTVESGDSLWSLARKYDTEVRIIREINFLKNDLLSINTTLLIPLSKTESNNFIPYEMHIVSEGDSLWRLAKKYNLEVIDIARMNNIDVNSYLQLGQQLTIGNKNIHRNMESKKRTILYSVKQGDNLYKISELFDVSVKSIKDINKFKEETLRPGQIIKVAIKAF